MLPQNFQMVSMKNGIDRGVYYDGVHNIFCLVINDTIIARSYSAYSIVKSLEDINSILATVNNLFQLEQYEKNVDRNQIKKLNSLSEEDEYGQRTQQYNH